MFEMSIKPLSKVAIGDTIRHKASGELAIVVSINDSGSDRIAYVSIGIGNHAQVEIYDGMIYEVVGVGESPAASEPAAIEFDSPQIDIDDLAETITDVLLSDEDSNPGVRLNVVMPENKSGGTYRRDDLLQIICGVLNGKLHSEQRGESQIPNLSEMGFDKIG